jgi:hypothetical protein
MSRVEIGVGAGIVALLLAVIAACIYAMGENQKQWNAFAEAHHCKVVAERQGSTQFGTGTAVGANGQVGMVTATTSTPDQVAYLCDDSVTYWRNR